MTNGTDMAHPDPEKGDHSKRPMSAWEREHEWDAWAQARRQQRRRTTLLVVLAFVLSSIAGALVVLWPR